MGMMDFLKKLKTAPPGEQPKLDLPPIPQEGQPADFRHGVDFPEIKIDAPQFAQKLPEMPDQKTYPAPPDMQGKGFEELLGSDQSWDEGFDELPGIQPVGNASSWQAKMDTPPTPQGKTSLPTPPGIPPWQAEKNMWQTTTSPIHSFEQGAPAPAYKIPENPDTQTQRPPLVQPKSMRREGEWNQEEARGQQSPSDKPPQFNPAIESWRNQQWPQSQEVQWKPEAPARPSWQGSVVQPDIEQGFVSYAKFQYVVETINSLVKEAKLAEDTIVRLKEINEDKDEIVSTWQQALEEVEKQLADFDQTLFG